MPDPDELTKGCLWVVLLFLALLGVLHLIVLLTAGTVVPI